MGVLNLTPDSFSDGGRLDSVEAVLAQARRMLAQGAAMLDLGAQSTRPGATEVGPTEELRRLLPALRALQQLRQEHPALLLSIDTFNASVAEAALAEGADWINDVRGANRTAEAPEGTLRDPAMLPLIARQGCPYVLMHSRGTSQSMDSLAAYGDVVAEVRAELQAATASALCAGVNPEQIIWDVGLGFAKTTAQNLELLRRLPELVETDGSRSDGRSSDGSSSVGRSSVGRSGYPLLVGPSRKRFIGAVLDEPRPRARLWGTAAVCTLAVAAGAQVLRVHDVGPIAQTVRMATAISPR
jgi:dihydropteroate synthase